MESLMKYINVIGRCAAQYRSEQLEQYGLNSRQHPYILHICRNPGISQEKLARAIYVNKSSVTRQLASLEQNGFIERTVSSTDKRAMLVYPTQKALEVFPIVRKVLAEWNQYITEDFNAEELELLLKMLQKVRDKATSYVETRDET